MFAHVGDSSKNGTKYLLRQLPILQEEEHQIQPFRYALHQRVKQLKTAHPDALPLRGVSAPPFTSKCFGCGRCVKNCRSGAIRLEDLEGGQSRVVITPWKCSECGMCVSSCNHHAIDGPEAAPPDQPGPGQRAAVPKAAVQRVRQTHPPRQAPTACAACAGSRSAPKSARRPPAARAKARAAERAAQRGSPGGPRPAAEEAAPAAAPLPDPYPRRLTHRR